MPQRSALTKLSVISNKSDRTIRFNINASEWFSEFENDYNSSIVHVYPTEGLIEPGKQQLLKVTVSAEGYARVIDQTVAVELMEMPVESTNLKVQTTADKDSERVKQVRCCAHKFTADIDFLACPPGPAALCCSPYVRRTNSTQLNSTHHTK